MEITLVLAHLSEDDVNKINILYDEIISKEGVDGFVTIKRYKVHNGHRIK